MSLSLQILIGIIVGGLGGVFVIISAINSKEKEFEKAWGLLVSALDVRYMKLKNVLNFLSIHMNEFNNEINELINLCDEAIDSDSSLKGVTNRLRMENSINYKLQEIKTNMINYPTIKDDPEVEAAILAIAESEASVGNAIRLYNGIHLEYSVFLEAFLISVVAWILNKTVEAPPFSVSEIQEFDDNYIDEDEI